MTNRTALLLLTALASGCAEPRHLNYDFGRAFTTSFTAQADLTRPSVANEQYTLYGLEGVAIRLNVQQASTDSSGGVITLGGR